MWIRNNGDGSCPDPTVESDREASDLPAGSRLLNFTSNGETSFCLYENIEQYFPIEAEATTLVGVGVWGHLPGIPARQLH